MGASIFMGYPKYMIYFRENPNMDDLGVPLWIGNHFMDFPKKKRKNALPAIGTPCAPATLSRLDRPLRCPRGVAVGSYPGSKGGGEQTSKMYWLVVDLPL